MKIAFGSTMGVGKDTAVEYLISKYGGSRISFASPIYDIMKYAQNICGFKNEKDRKFLQIVGTEWARSKENDVWIRIALEKGSKEKGNVFISDLRFQNEFDALKLDNWLCVKLVKCDIKNTRVGSGKETHSSEGGLEDSSWDYVINNNGTIEEFFEKLDKLVSK
jgi:hypothetical protein